jgi:uncharacterized protein (DUF58 family)
VSRPRIYLRSEGWYFLSVVLFVLGGSVLRQVNLLVALAGLMIAVLLIHYQLIVQSLARLDILRTLPPRICAGDVLEVEVTITNGYWRGPVFGLHFREELQRMQPDSTDAAGVVSLMFPVVEARSSTTRRYALVLSRRGIYRCTKTELLCRYPFGLLEGQSRLPMADSLVVNPRVGQLKRAWRELIDADHDGQQRSRHRRGTLEADFYALREWRNGDSRRWIHWRTSAKLGTLAVRQFEQRRSCELVLVLDLWQPSAASVAQREAVEEVISFAATALNDLARQGGAQLTFILAGREFRAWHASASSLLTQELLEQLAICQAAETPDLASAELYLKEHLALGTRVIVLSTRARNNLPAQLTKASEKIGEAHWLNAADQEFQPYFSFGESAAS